VAVDVEQPPLKVANASSTRRSWRLPATTVKT
jgi:hypothetical protein